MNTNNQSIVPNIPDSMEQFTAVVFNQEVLQKADDWESLLSLWLNCHEIEQEAQWYKGDIACKIETKFGESGLEKFAQAVHVPYQTMVAYRRTSRAFDFNKRLLKLSWSHHFIASQIDSWDKDKEEFTTSKRLKWIEKADDENWSANRLKMEIVMSKTQDNKELYHLCTETISRFSNIYKHWDVNKLNKEQKEELVKILDNLIGEFKNLLLKEEETGNLLTPST